MVSINISCVGMPPLILKSRVFRVLLVNLPMGVEGCRKDSLSLTFKLHGF